MREASVTKRAMLLLNCTRCDDVVKLVEGLRACECGATLGKADEDGNVETIGPARVLSIAWRVYDGLGDGGQGSMDVLPRAQYRAKGS
jgi:hypothetical protein